MRSGIEIELKLTVPEGFDLAATTAALDGFTTATAAAAVDGPVTLQATYWDTDACDLLALGHSLRHRTSDDGREDGWTLKLAAPNGGGGDALARRERSFGGAAATPPGAALDVLRGVLGGRSLRPVCSITTVRTLAVVHADGPAATIELALDQVTSTVHGTIGPEFVELEAELIDGDPAALRRLGKALRSVGASAADPTPKVVRVLRAAGDIDGAPAPAASEVPATVAELVAGAIGGARRALLARDAALRLDTDPDDVHKARVATRRLRSDLRSLASHCDGFRVDGLRRELAWLGAMLGRVRDLDVLTERLLGQLDRIGIDRDLPAAAALRDRLAAQRRTAVHELWDVLDSGRYLGLLADLERLTGRPPLATRAGGDHEGPDGTADAAVPDSADDGADDGAEPARPAARHAADEALARVRRRIRRLGPDPSAEQLHDLRKAAKRARYAAELAGPLSKGRTDRLARRLADLQDTLGRNQDAVTARAWLVRTADAVHDPAEAFLLGRLLEHNRTEAPDLGEVLAAWHRASAPKAVRWLR